VVDVGPHSAGAYACGAEASTHLARERGERHEAGERVVGELVRAGEPADVGCVGCVSVRLTEVSKERRGASETLPTVSNAPARIRFIVWLLLLLSGARGSEGIRRPYKGGGWWWWAGARASPGRASKGATCWWRCGVFFLRDGRVDRESVAWLWAALGVAACVCVRACG